MDLDPTTLRGSSITYAGTHEECAVFALSSLAQNVQSYTDEMNHVVHDQGLLIILFADNMLLYCCKEIVVGEVISMVVCGIYHVFLGDSRRAMGSTRTHYNLLVGLCVH